MKQIVLCFLAIFAGALIGSVANILIISFSTTIIPLPKGADNSSIKSLEQTIHLFQFKHFIMPPALFAKLWNIYYASFGLDHLVGTG